MKKAVSVAAVIAAVVGAVVAVAAYMKKKADAIGEQLDYDSEELYEDELDELLAHWKTCPNVEMEGCFTHFCAAETEPDFTQRQNAVFAQMLAHVREAGYAPIAHAAASTAMLCPIGL